MSMNAYIVRKNLSICTFTLQCSLVTVLGRLLHYIAYSEPAAMELSHQKIWLSHSSVDAAADWVWLWVIIFFIDLGSMAIEPLLVNLAELSYSSQPWAVSQEWAHLGRTPVLFFYPYFPFYQNLLCRGIGLDNLLAFTASLRGHTVVSSFYVPW